MKDDRKAPDCRQLKEQMAAAENTVRARGTPADLRRLRDSQIRLGQLLLDEGCPENALELWERAASLNERLLLSAPAASDMQNAAALHLRLGDLLSGADGRDARPIAHYEYALSLAGRLPPGQPSAKTLADAANHRLACVFWRKRFFGTSLRYLHRAAQGSSELAPAALLTPDEAALMRTCYQAAAKTLPGGSAEGSEAALESGSLSLQDCSAGDLAALAAYFDVLAGTMASAGKAQYAIQCWTNSIAAAVRSLREHDDEQVSALLQRGFAGLADAYAAVGEEDKSDMMRRLAGRDRPD